jgi:hypothetical protein
MNSIEPSAALSSRRGGTSGSLRFSQLSAPRQALVRLCQRMNYGSIEGLPVEDTEPVLRPAPLVLIDLKLDADESPRPEVDLSDFELCAEIRRLMSRLDAIPNGVIERIEVRAGIPRRMLLRGPLTQPDAARRCASTPRLDLILDPVPNADEKG